MRIISGKYGGRKLKENKFEHIRPTADMVKQALFNKLGTAVLGAKVLDLCCGTGSLGIEAISRGASEVVFVDSDSRSLDLVRQNLALINCQARLVKADALAACKTLEGQGFDLILFDPPYKSDLYLTVPQNLARYGVLAKGGMLVIEQAKEDNFAWPEQFEVADQRTYGIKQLTFLRLK